MKKALLRLSLIIFPLALLSVALYLNHNKEPFEAPPKTSCPFFLGLSSQPVDLFEKKHNYPLTSEQDFLLLLREAKKLLKKNNIPLKYFFLNLPLYLTKDNHWLIAERSFIISENSERKEISHLDYKTLRESFFKHYKSNPLTLKNLLKKEPSLSLFLRFETQDVERIVSNLTFVKNHKGPIKISSLNEKLLAKIFETYPSISLFHSFKKFIHFQILSVLQLNSAIYFPGNGVLISSPLIPSQKIVNKTHQLKKLLIWEKTNKQHSLLNPLTLGINGLISPNIEDFLPFIKKKKTCFLNN